MKKYFYSVLAAGMLFATSCSQDNDLVDVTGGESRMVTLKVKVPNQTESRAVGGAEIGDGSKANTLIWAMYEANTATNESNDTLITGKTVETSDGLFSISVPMAKDLRYDLLFLAYNEDNCPFELDATPNKTDLRALQFKNIQKANNESMDAFVGVHNVGIDNQSVTELELHRPFAQINAATSLQDMKDANTLKTVVTKAMMTIKGAPKYYNVYSGETKDTVNVTYVAGEVLNRDGATDYPKNETITVDGTDYYYLSLAYVLAGADKDSKESIHETDFEFYRSNGDKVSSLDIQSLPIQRNYRTNIVGNLLTKVEDYQIKIDAEFGGSHKFEIWDGKTYKEPQKDANGAYLVSSAPEYAWLSRYSNTGSRALASVEGTIEIVSDIDLGGYTISAIAVNNNSLTVNGNGHCIKNASVVSGENDNGTEQASLFFGSTGTTLTIKDLNVDNLVVKAKKEAYDVSGFAAAIVAYSQTTLTLENVHVTNSTMYATQTLGALVGMVEGTNKAVIKNCSADGITLNNYEVEDESGNTGGLIGKVAGGATLEMENTSVKNTVINASILRGDQARTVSKYIGNYVGGANGSITIVNGSIDNVTLNIAEGSVADQSCLYGDFLGGWRYDGGTVTINGAEITKENNIIDNATEFAAAITSAKDGAVIPVKGTIATTELKANGKSIIIQGMSDDATIDITSDDKYSDCGGNITFKNLTIKMGSDRNHYDVGLHNQGGTHVYDDCKFEGIATAWGDCTYNNCEFTNTTDGKYAAWVYAGTVVYNNCTFTGVDRAAKVFNENPDSNMNVTYNNCTFKATTPDSRASSNKAAVEVAVMNNTSKATVVNIVNPTLVNMGEAEHYGSEIFNIEYKYENDSKFGNAIVTVDGETYAVVCKEEAIKQALAMDSKNITMMLSQDALLDNGTGTNWGGVSTESIKIGSVLPNNTEKWTLTLSNSYRDYIQTNGAKVVMENIKLASSEDKDGSHWHNYAPKFNCDVDMNGVDMLNSFCFEKTAVLNNITVNCGWPATVYGMWITAGADVTIDGLTLKAQRGIKIADEDTPEQVATLKVSNANFTTKKKAAILATTAYGADITLSNINIDNVEADKENVVWVDEERADYFDLVTVTGGSKWLEGEFADGLSKNGVTYKVRNANGLATLNNMMADKSAGRDAVVNIIADIDFTGKTWTPVDSHADTAFEIAEINGNGHTISNLTINGQAMFKRFAGSGDVTIKNVTFDNAKVNSTAINTSILTVQSYQNVLLDNVDVKNSSITGAYKVAPLIATVYNESSSTVTATLKNCDVENVTVKATQYDFCTTGMVAFVYASDNDKIELENCTVKDVKLIAPEDSYKAHAAIYTTGSGSLYNEAEGVTVTNVTFEALN